MGLKEQLEKTEGELKKLDEKKEKFLQEHDAKRKKLMGRKKELESKIVQEKNEKILNAVHENFGEINEENLGLFFDILKKNKEEFSLEMEIAAEDSKEEISAGEMEGAENEQRNNEGIWISTILFPKGVNLWNNVQFQFESEFQKKNCAL